MSFITEGFDSILEFGDEVFTAVGDTLENAVEFIGGEGNFDPVRSSWDEMFADDLKFGVESSLDQETLIDNSYVPEPNPPSQAFTPKIIEPPGIEPPGKESSMLSGLSPTALKIGAGAVVGFAQSKEAKRVRRQAHKDRLKRLTHEYKLSSKPLKPWG